MACFLDNILINLLQNDHDFAWKLSPCKGFCNIPVLGYIWLLWIFILNWKLCDFEWGCNRALDGILAPYSFFSRKIEDKWVHIRFSYLTEVSNIPPGSMFLPPLPSLYQALVIIFNQPSISPFYSLGAIRPFSTTLQHAPCLPTRPWCSMYLTLPQLYLLSICAGEIFQKNCKPQITSYQSIGLDESFQELCRTSPEIKNWRCSGPLCAPPV